MKRFLLLLSLFVSVAFAQGTLEVISLRHRTVDQVIPVLRPLLEPGGVLSGQFSSLIVRTSPENLVQIRAALDAIDRPARRLVISVRFDSTLQSERSARGEQVDQRIQVLEGGQATISTGESRNYAQAGTGIAVLPRVSGNNVTLEIGAQQEAFSRGGAIQGERAASTIGGRLGEWIDLGGASSTSSRSDSGILSSTERNTSGSRGIWVKVEELR
jgi:type II secretory pathway component GspD/PulD (secretin)